MMSVRTRPAWFICVVIGLRALSCSGSGAAAEDPEAAVQRLAGAIEAGDTRAIRQLYVPGRARAGDQLWGRWSSIFAAYDRLDATLQLLLRGIAGSRALVRCAYTVTGQSVRQPGGPRYLVFAETVDMPLEQHGGRWLLGGQEWRRPDAERRAARLLTSAGSLPEHTVVHMVLRMQGGIWWPVRHLIWSGDIGGARGATTTDQRKAIGEILQKRHALKQQGALHIFAAKHADGWGAPQDLWHAASAAVASVEQQLREQTTRVEAAFGDPGEHQRLADVLYDAARYALAVEEYQKAKALDPTRTNRRLARALRALQRQEELRQWQERLNAQRAAELSAEGQRVAQNRSAVSLLKPPQVLVCDHAIVRHERVEPLLTDVMAAVEEAHRKAVTAFGFPMESVQVSVFRTRQAYQEFRRRRGDTAVPEWSGGTSGVDGILTYSHKGVGKSIAHEYGHEAVRQFVGGAAVPVWLNEGIAIIMEDAFADHERLTAELYRRRGGAFFPVDALSGPWTLWPTERARYAYAQARGMVEYMLATRGKEPLLHVLRDMRRRVTYDEAFGRNLGTSQAGFQQQWAAYARSRMPRSRGRRTRGQVPSGEREADPSSD